MKYGFIVKNLVLAVIFVLALGFISNAILKSCTRHNSSVEVPDLIGLSILEARSAAVAAGLEINLADSVYVRDMAKGAVFAQYPKAGAKVKENRTLDLTINAFSNRKVTVPSLIGNPLRQAKAELQSRSLVLGKLNYVPDIATNVVLRQRYKGRDIFAGDKVDAGSVIDLDLGLNFEENHTMVPDVRTMSFGKASDILKDSYLNVTAKFPKAVRTYSDSISAVVVKQSPEPSSEAVTMGTEVTIVLKFPAKSSGK